MVLQGHVPLELFSVATYMCSLAFILNIAALFLPEKYNARYKCICSLPYWSLCQRKFLVKMVIVISSSAF